MNAVKERQLATLEYKALQKVPHYRRTAYLNDLILGTQTTRTEDDVLFEMYCCTCNDRTCQSCVHYSEYLQTCAVIDRE